MVETSDEPSFLDRIRSAAFHNPRRPSQAKSDVNVLPLNNVPRSNGQPFLPPGTSKDASDGSAAAQKSAPDETGTVLPPPAPPPESKEGNRAENAEIEGASASMSTGEGQEKKKNVFIRFYNVVVDVLFSSIFNLLLVFVPVGIALGNTNANPIAVFAVNAIAIIPLAGLLAHATEAVAASLGDTIGALMNVTFGNAVELIIFIIALVKNEIRIVQASIVGSILANLLLILGMCFLFGGLRYREQIYNSQVTQMSACLLSLSATSLLLPTAFHASFTDSDAADISSLALSRASSIILLLIYVLYLLFQLKSHAYMYESTPQHVIDEESYPGVLANMMNNSSSSSGTDSDSDADSDASSGSRTTIKRIRQALRGRKRRKSSASSDGTPSVPSALLTPRTPSIAPRAEATPLNGPLKEVPDEGADAIASGDEADTDGERRRPRSGLSASGVISRDFEDETRVSRPSSKTSRKHGRKHKKHRKPKADKDKHSRSIKFEDEEPIHPPVETSQQDPTPVPLQEGQADAGSGVKRPFIRTLSSVRPAMPKILTSTVFSATNPTGQPAPAGVFVPRAPYGLRRTNSLPDRLHFNHSALPSQPDANALSIAHAPKTVSEGKDDKSPKAHMSRTSAALVLLCSTALVALCAEYLVNSINYMVASTTLSQAFIGLIILPIVGNAAEHVTAVTVASKNKMDLAIGVAIGSSIQIALFVTPVVILLGWIMNKEMSLYFSLFETVALFVSAFIINFLILDGRSNYLEGALLMAAYVIIAIAAFYYPNVAADDGFGGITENATDSTVIAGLVNRTVEATLKLY